MAVKLFAAAKAFIEHQGKFLVLREAGSYVDGTNHGRYDVPGGRITPGEPLRTALVREVMEETGLTVTSAEPFYVLEWSPQKGDDTWHIVGTCWKVRVADPSVIQLSTDHDDFAWVDPTDLDGFPVIDNLKPAFIALAGQSK